MKVVGLDGKYYTWNPVAVSHLAGKVSSFHEETRKLLKQLFPLDIILEEVSLPGTKPILYADFYIPLRRMIVEVHGQQHYEWIPHYHGTKKDFLMAQKNDKRKKEWCELNELEYIELPYSETLDEWRSRILQTSS